MNALVELPLAELPALIRRDIDRRNSAVDDWRSATLDLCEHLLAARKRFSAHQAFHEWLDKNGFSTNVLNKNDRAAAIAMGEHIDVARDILAHTERRSLQLIYAEDFEPRFPSARKTPSSHNAVATTKRKPAARGEPKAPRASRRTPQEITAKDEAIAAAHIDEGKPRAQVAAEFGVKELYVRETSARVEAARAAKADPQITREDLPLSAQQKFDAAIRQATRSLEVEFERRVLDECQKRLDEFVLPHFNKKAAEAEQVLKARKGVMTRAAYRKILACLHPDNSMGHEAREAAFDTFKQLELALVAEAEMPTSPTGLPRTVEEMLARRKRAR